MTDLFADLKTCWSGLKLQHCERVLPRSVWPYLTQRGLLGYAKVRAGREDRWDFDEAGIGCLTVAVHADDGALIDIVAFEPNKPNQWLVRTGNGYFLGENILATAERGIWTDADVPVVVPTPLEWLQMGGRAVCIVDPTPRSLARIRNLGTLKVPSPRFAQALRLQMSRPPRLPEIKILEREKHAA
jgi:hypothetical protein